MSDGSADLNPMQAPPRWAPADLPKIRARVKKSLTAEIDGVLLPQGFRREGSRWTRRGMMFDVYFEFQKSQYGFSCYFNIGRMSRLGDMRFGGHRHWRMNSFLPTTELKNEYDAHYYVDLDGDTPRRREIMRQLNEICLPLLEGLAGWKGPWLDLPPGSS